METQLFVTQNGHFGAHFLTPVLPPKSLCGSLSRVLPQETRQKAFPGGPAGRLLGVVQVVYAEKVCALGRGVAQSQKQSNQSAAFSMFWCPHFPRFRSVKDLF